MFFTALRNNPSNIDDIDINDVAKFEKVNDMNQFVRSPETNQVRKGKWYSVDNTSNEITFLGKFIKQIKKNKTMPVDDDNDRTGSGEYVESQYKFKPNIFTSILISGSDLKPANNSPTPKITLYHTKLNFGGKKRVKTSKKRVIKRRKNTHRKK